MTNREALRDFQSRLAGKLAQAKTEAVSSQWLAVERGALRLLVPLAHAGEIFPAVHVNRVPYTKAWYLGIANLRGALFGVVDMALYLPTLPEQPIGRVQTRDQSRLLTFNPAMELPCALLIDSLVGLRTAADFVSVSASDGQAAFITAVHTDAENQSWTQLNLHQLAHSADFLSIGVMPERSPDSN